MKQLVALTLDQLEDFIAISDIRLLKRVVMSTHRASSFWATTRTGILPWLYQPGTFLWTIKLGLFEMNHVI